MLLLESGVPLQRGAVHSRGMDRCVSRRAQIVVSDSGNAMRVRAFEVGERARAGDVVSVGSDRPRSFVDDARRE
uniref:hypothetical protein n=1 Tax=Burkholderia anthina TaxID=179879 RepID=UPI00158DE3E5|nr:hypothetical protein [Burkholderia anthina]